MSAPPRDVIFISHATPEDNDFVKWLGARLIGLGYNVWADVFELKGGTPFWKNIEEAIRTRAFKVIYAASSASVDPNRKGIRDELAAASIVATKLVDPEYIIPVRVDKVDFGAFPIQVVQLNALDFSSGWGSALPDLIETLEKAKAPLDPSKVDERMRFWKERTSRDAPQVEIGPELLLTNLLPIMALPKQINFYDFSGPNTEIKAALDATGIPYYRFVRLIVSFASPEHLRAGLPPQFALSLEKTVDLQKFLEGPTGTETAPLRQEARNALNYLMRLHTQRYLLSKGLRLYESSGGNAFFFPVDMIPGRKVWYETPDGKTTWKAVTGWSEKRRVHWHLSMLVNIDLGPPGFVRFKPYVCFSEDGKAPIIDPKRIAGLRRRFCKSWWNRHWRQLQQAFTAFLSGGAEQIVVALDGPEQLVLRGSLLQLEGVRRLLGDIDLADTPEEPEELEEEDEPEEPEETEEPTEETEAGDAGDVDGNHELIT